MYRNYRAYLWILISLILATSISSAVINDGMGQRIYFNVRADSHKVHVGQTFKVTVTLEMYSALNTNVYILPNEIKIEKLLPPSFELVSFNTHRVINRTSTDDVLSMVDEFEFRAHQSGKYDLKDMFRLKYKAYKVQNNQIKFQREFQFAPENSYKIEVIGSGNVSPPPKGSGKTTVPSNRGTSNPSTSSSATDKSSISDILLGKEIPVIIALITLVGLLSWWFLRTASASTPSGNLSATYGHPHTSPVQAQNETSGVPVYRPMYWNAEVEVVPNIMQSTAGRVKGSSSYDNSTLIPAMLLSEKIKEELTQVLSFISKLKGELRAEKVNFENIDSLVLNLDASLRNLLNYLCTAYNVNSKPKKGMMVEVREDICTTRELLEGIRQNLSQSLEFYELVEKILKTSDEIKYAGLKPEEKKGKIGELVTAVEKLFKFELLSNLLKQVKQDGR